MGYMATIAPQCRPAPNPANTIGSVEVCSRDHSAAAISNDADEVFP
jgi:hypothetical protein